MARCGSCTVTADVARRCRRVFEALRGEFLVPTGFPGHAHAWVALDAGYSICSVCGAEHLCFRGECALSETEASERVCEVSGCVIVPGELRPEFEALDRVAVFTRPGGRRGGVRRGGASAEPGPPVPCARPLPRMDVPEFVEGVVREVLDSGRTQQCRCLEAARDHSRRMSALGRLLREWGRGKGEPPARVNLVDVEAQLAWSCRKCRPARQRGRATIDRVIRVCVDSISTLIAAHGWERVGRQLQHPTRGREFVCSMLYLMRVGITFRNRCLLLRLDLLHELLPLQVYLPQVFRIRAKSITEGENIIKLDIRRIPP